jgi:heme O synthase-like polyprenyltransferase
MLPLIDVTAIAPTPTKAVALAKRSAGALETYVERQQRMNHVPTSDRVIVQEVVSPKKVHVYRARSKTMPVVVFLGVMFAFIGLAFLLENLRPRRVVVEPSNSEFANTKARLTA